MTFFASECPASNGDGIVADGRFEELRLGRIVAQIYDPLKCAELAVHENVGPPVTVHIASHRNA